MYIATVPNRGSAPAILLRQGYREDGKVKTRTLGNLSHLPAQTIELIRRSLRGETLMSPEQAFEITASRHHGHVEAVMLAMRRLGFERLLSTRRSRQRDLAVAMVAARILQPDSKLATTRWWHSTTLPEQLAVGDAKEDELYEAMDWLLDRQAQVQKSLAARHLEAGGLMLYDLSSSYFEGCSCPLAARGHNRDGKQGKLQVNYGMLTDQRGCPVAVSVFDGNTSDTKTAMSQVNLVRQQFKLEQLVLVGDRGMISQKLIDEQLRQLDGVDWISALKNGTIRKLVDEQCLQLGLFDEQRLFEFACDDYPGERFVACRNPELAKLRAYKRQSLLEATTRRLEQIRASVQRARLRAAKQAKASGSAGVQPSSRHLGKHNIGVRAGKVINRHKVSKHFVLDIRDNSFDFHIDEDKVAAEARLDGIYVVRTSLPTERMSSEDAVRNYKSLSQVERAFRSLKTVDLKVRPIHHRLEPRVRAHILLCMLAYYVEWHMQQAWRPLLFADEDQAAKKHRDPVAPARRSQAAQRKAKTKRLADGTTVVQSLHTLLAMLSTIVRNDCRPAEDSDTASVFQLTTTPNAHQQRALDLLKTISAQA